MEDGVSVRLLHNQVLIRRTPDEKVGRFFVPGNADTKPRIGIVEAVGPGKRAKNGERIPMSVRVGDRVRFDAGHKGYVVNLPGSHPLDTRLIIPEDGILAVLVAGAEASSLGSPWPSYITDGVQGGDHSEVEP
jgi:chaperonin GroES